MVLRIPFRPPIDWPGLLEFLGKRAIEGVERVGRGRYERSFRAASGVGVLSVGLARDARALELSVPDETGPDLIGVVENVARLFDLHADPLPIWSHLRRDSLLRASLGSARGVPGTGGFRSFRDGRASRARPADLRGGRAHDRRPHRGPLRREARSAPRGRDHTRLPRGRPTRHGRPRERGPDAGAGRTAFEPSRSRSPRGNSFSTQGAVSSLGSRSSPSFRESGPGRRTTSRCAPSASRTHSRPAISACDTRSPTARCCPVFRTSRSEPRRGAPGGRTL